MLSWRPRCAHLAAQMQGLNSTPLPPPPEKGEYKKKNNAEKEQQRRQWMEFKTSQYIVTTEYEDSWPRVDFPKGLIEVSTLLRTWKGANLKMLQLH